MQIWWKIMKDYVTCEHALKMTCALNMSVQLLPVLVLFTIIGRSDKNGKAKISIHLISAFEWNKMSWSDDEGNDFQQKELANSVSSYTFWMN